jgi:hypothetical protein
LSTTFDVLENRIPNFFDGVKNLYYNDLKGILFPIFSSVLSSFLKKKKLNGREKKILQCFTRKTEKKKSFLTLLSKSKSFSSLLLYLLLIFVVLSEFFLNLSIGNLFCLRWSLLYLKHRIFFHF